MRGLGALVVYLTAIGITSLASELTQTEECPRVLGAIPMEAALRAGVSHLEQARFPGKWGRVQFVVVTTEGTDFQYVYSRDRKRIRRMQQAGQVQYAVNLVRVPIAWSAERPDFLRHLKVIGALPAGKVKAIVRDIPGGSSRWHELKVISYQDGIGRVLDDDGNEKPLSLASRSGKLERKKYDASFGQEKRTKFEAYLSANVPVYVFTADKVVEFAAENILLIDTEMDR